MHRNLGTVVIPGNQGFAWLTDTPFGRVVQAAIAPRVGIPFQNSQFKEQMKP
jgi:hypothetical protein